MTDDLELWTRAARPYADWTERDVLRAELLDPALDRCIGDPRDLLAADLGCGHGAWVARLAGAGARVRACDAVPAFVEAARVAAPQGSDVRIVEHDLLAPLPDDATFPSGKFDVVLVNMVLHALSDLRPLLTSIHRILAPAGRAVLSTVHPAFTPPAAKVHAGVLGRIHPRFRRVVVLDYFTEKRVSRRIQGSTVPTVPVYHRTLETLITSLSAAGLAVTGLLEPRPENASATATTVATLHARTAPIHLILEAQRHG